MLDTILYNSICRLFNEKFDQFESFQLCTSDITLFTLLYYIQDYFRQRGKVINIFFIRRSRTKQPPYSKIEWSINNDTIIVIEQYWNEISDIEYISASLKVLNKEITQIFSLFQKQFYDYNKVQCWTLKYIWRYWSTSYWFFSENSPVLYKNYLIFSDNIGTIFSLDKNSLDVIWKYPVNTMGKPLLFSESCIIHDKIIIGTCTWEILKIDIHTWIVEAVDCFSDFIENSCIYIEEYDLIIVAVNNFVGSQKNFILFLKFSSFERIWQLLLDSRVCSNSLYIREKKLLCFSDDSGKTYGVDIHTRTIRFMLKLKWINEWWLVYYKDKKVLICSTTSWYVYSINPSNGTILSESYMSDYWSISQPLMLNNRIYIWSVDKHMYIFDAELNNIWQIQTSGRIFSSPISIKNRYIVFGSNDGNIYIYDDLKETVDSFQIWERIVNNIVYDSFLDRLLILDFLNNLYVIDFHAFSNR